MGECHPILLLSNQSCELLAELPTIGVKRPHNHEDSDGVAESIDDEEGLEVSCKDFVIAYDCGLCLWFVLIVTKLKLHSIRYLVSRGQGRL
jgi:hypothetical protein